MEVRTLTKEQLENVTRLENIIAQQISQLGMLSYEEITARQRTAAAMQAVEATAQEKAAYYESLREIYGEGTINIAEGTFIPNPS